MLGMRGRDGAEVCKFSRAVSRGMGWGERHSGREGRMIAMFCRPWSVTLHRWRRGAREMADTVIFASRVSAEARALHVCEVHEKVSLLHDRFFFRS